MDFPSKHFFYIFLVFLEIFFYIHYNKNKIFYLHIEAESEFQRNETATHLKEKNITPLPLEFEKKISKTSYYLIVEDSNEVAYKKNLKIL